MSNAKRKTSVVAMMAVLASLLLPVLAAAPAGATTPINVSFDNQGCKLPATYSLTPQPHCADADYHSGNLGKGWNELDLVPFRLFASTGNQNGTPATQTYNVSEIVDYKDGTPLRPGYDVLSVLTKNTALSTGGGGNCAIVNGAETVLTPGLGGIAQSLYRDLAITQAKNTTCVFDFYARLAVGSHLFPGSSLHTNLANENHTTAGIGAQDISIPVREILPQAINKTMTAVQDSAFAWTINKGVAPDHLQFGNICDTTNLDTTLQTDVTITWTKVPGDAQDIQVHTLVEASNPAARVITVQVTDQLRSGTTVLQTHNGLAVDVPANSTGTDVLAYDTTVPAGTTNLNDIAVATYTDKLTGVPVPGNTTATATAAVQGGSVINGTATITDVENISGAGLSFSVDSVTGDADALNSATLDGTSPGPVTWTSGPVSAGGSVVLHKTVTLDPAVGATSGALTDTATVTGSDGFTTSANEQVNLDSTLSGSLTINKTTSVPVDGDTVFEFAVTPGDIPVTVTILDGQTSGSSDALTGLAAGDYNVEETNANGFTPADDQQFTIGAGACTAELDFQNTFGPASLQVFKATVPPGAEAGWAFTVTKNGNAFATGTSDAAGVVIWDPNPPGTDTLVIADEGHYVVTETGGPPGYDSSSQGDCDFTVDFPTDADRPFVCTFTNTRQTGTIIVDKVTNPVGSPQSFDFVTSYAPGSFSLTDADTPNNSGKLPTGVYSVAELPTAGWDLTNVTCSDGSLASAIDLGADETVTCTFTNTQQGTIIVKKVTDPAGSPQSFEFTPSYNGGTKFSLTDGQQNDSGLLVPGKYNVAETAIPGWDLTSATCDKSETISDIDVGAGETVTCTFVNTQRGAIEITKTFNGQPPAAGSSYTFQLRTGASQGVEGTIQSTLVLNGANSFKGSFGNLVPGDYQVCETNIPVGGHSDLSDRPGAFTPTPDPGDNSTQCAPITVGAGETVKITVNNTPPPGGDQRTIGYWKNWASCAGSTGKQAPKLDQTLYAAGANGISVGDLVLHGGSTPNLSPDCLKAVRILDKSDIVTGKKMASDPAYNLAAQLLAAKLNVVAGAGQCPAATQAISDAQTLLDAINFNGTGSYANKMTSAQKTLANQLATTLDQYNNGSLC